MENAREWLEMLSLHSASAPEVSSYPNGEIGFDWHTDKGALSILLDERNIYFYSKTRNGKRRKGFEVWTKTIPQEILDKLGAL